MKANHAIKNVKDVARKGAGEDTKEKTKEEAKEMIRGNIRKITRMAVDGIFPPACPICSKPAPVVKSVRLDVCMSCMDKLEYIKEPYCLKCGKEIEDFSKEYCYDCMRFEHSFDFGRAVFSYTEGIKKSIYRYKYKNKREYSLYYAKEMAKKWGKDIKRWAPQVIIPVPLHEKKLRQRGYNQAALIAQNLGRILNIPVDDGILIRIRNTTPMKELNDSERVNNLENAFNITRNVVKYNKVLIVDDIYTTGSTIDECSRILKLNGVEKVYFLCICAGIGLV